MSAAKTPAPAPIAEPSGKTAQSERWFVGRRFRPFFRFGIFAGILGLIFVRPLMQLIYLALDVDLHSHILLIPFICCYLVWIRRGELPLKWVPALRLAAALFLSGICILIADWIFLAGGWHPKGDDQLTIMISAFYFLVLSGCAAFWGRDLMRALIFPLGMLIFIVPLPDLAIERLEVFLQHASADVAHLFFLLSGTPVFREGLVFLLPNLTIEVARECSGIRSSLVLFITGLLASHLYLRTPWKKATLVVVTLLFGIVRNAFRIFTLVMLTIHVDPETIHSGLHKRGGPLFFALSLVPLFGLLILLRKSEMRKDVHLPNK